MKLKFVLVAILILAICSPNFAQLSENDLINWQLRNADGKIPGTGIEDVYKKLLKNKAGHEVIVAVLDGGVDINHEDLKQNIWVNPKEIPGNNKDDDGNGYVDDVYGWNFIGNASGANVQYDSYETTRTLATLRKKYKNTKPESVPKEQQVEFKRYQDLELDIDGKRKNAETQWEELKRNEGLLLQVIDAVAQEIGSQPLSLKTLEKVDTNKNVYINIGTKILTQILQEQSYVNSFDQINQSIKTEYSAPRADLEAKFLYQYNADYDSRTIVGDHYDDPYEKYYGNNDVKGPDAFHGTHVSGIIAAVRNNGLGIDGIATNVKIMAVRVVPDGDERDKDIANGIRYAVDNGAKVINMSFGKGESPYKKAIDDAILYAAKHDVLLVHAAGNAGEDNDATLHFPVNKLDRKCLFCKKEIKGWLDIGASSFTKDEDLVASFSNYGKKSVDIFSPGVRIYSTTPENKYEFADGTSMASPVMAGVAAVIRSYYPKLSAKQVRKAIIKNGNAYNGKVIKPGTSDSVPLSELCISGSYVNAFKAIEAASKMKGNRPVTSSVVKPKA